MEGVLLDPGARAGLGRSITDQAGAARSYTGAELEGISVIHKNHAAVADGVASERLALLASSGQLVDRESRHTQGHTADNTAD